ncbi:MAG: hypothetical protein HN416_14250 [Nitrospina sp.]|jgi:hypothetical protein|nr:hypothetical protein [Nitrospina sp.]
MKKQKMIILVGVFIITLLLSFSVAFAQATVNWGVIAGGGGPSSAGATTLNATLGQPFVGSAIKGTTGLGHGFWSGFIAEVAPTIITLRSITADISDRPLGTLLFSLILITVVVAYRIKRKRASD